MPSEEVTATPPGPEDETPETEIEMSLEEETPPLEVKPPVAGPQAAEAVEIPKPRRGKKTGMKRFPAPATRYYHDEHTSESGKPSEFFRYWKRICSDPELRQRVVAYIYRSWPAMVDGKRQVDKIYDNPLTMDDVLKRYGCGDYVIRVNDSGNGNLNITNCSIKNLGARQLNDFPPVLDIRDVDLDDKSNRSYLLWAKSRGLLTAAQEQRIQSGDSEKKEEGEMANAEAIKQLATTVDRMTDKVIETAKEKEKVTSGGGMPEKLLDLITVASTSATQSAAQIVHESVKQVLELQKANANPVQNVKEVAQTLKDLMAPQQNIRDVMEFMTQHEKQYVDRIFQLQNERIQSLEKLIEARINAMAAQPPAALPAPAAEKNPLQQIRELANLKDELRELLGIEEKAESEPAWMKYAPVIIQAVNVLGAYFANAMHNLAVAKTGQGQPAPPPAAAPPQNGSGAAVPATEGSAAPATEMPQSQENAMERFQIFLRMIERPLLRSFTQGESGAEFAAKLIELTEDGMFGPQTGGRQVYDAVLEYGQEVVATLIKTYPPIWSVVSQTPQKWEKFLSEFFSADKIWEEEDAQETAPPASQEPAGRRNKKA